MTARARCSTCGQPLPDTPVYLPPVPARIFNAIRRAGPEGITSDVLIDDYGLGISTKTLKVHIHEINLRIAPHGLYIPDARKNRIGSDGRGGRRRLGPTGRLGIYRVVKIAEVAS